tara:strand:- start:1671 stop:1922 length:252 start_codon:yes stop_codon:yes gene_type:complete
MIWVIETVPNFNSYLVRLEVDQVFEAQKGVTDFNSYLVRLEEAELSDLKDVLSDFNSYLVRLEVKSSTKTLVLPSISIPTWCD